MHFCSACGTEILPPSSVCHNCGQPQVAVLSKSHTTTLLLCFFLGSLGVHRIYLGRVLTAVIMILTGGGLGVWVAIDFIRLVFGRFTDAGGNELQGKNKTLCMILFSVFCLIVLFVIILFYLALSRYYSGSI